MAHLVLVPAAVDAVARGLLEPGAGGVGEGCAVLPLHVCPVLAHADVDVPAAAPALGQAPLRAARAPTQLQRLISLDTSTDIFYFHFHGQCEVMTQY